ncbi:hypothetical protein HDZ31DRAFT_43611 [Schizophyllum fasciatum]
MSGVLQLFRAVGKFLSGPQLDPEKMLPPKSEPHFSINRIVEDMPSDSSPKELLDKIIARNSELDPHWDETLRTCVVEEVLHYRGNPGGKAGHEAVVVRFSHTATDDNGVSHTDYRAMKMERLKEVHRGEHTALVPSYPVVRDITREQLARDGTENRDRVSFISDLDYWVTRGNLELVASFVPPQNSLNVVDCAVAAFVLTERAIHYTTLQFMCMWYARMLFETLRRLAGGPPGRDGPAYASAGKFGRFRLVTSDARLKLRETERTLNEAGDQVFTLLRLRHSAGYTDDELLAMREAFLRKFQEGEGKPMTIEPLREVEAQVRHLRDSYWKTIESAARKAYDIKIRAVRCEL